ncbi:MAG: hypothetical protein V4858_03115 [Pseudomonadota bacterium]
MNHTQTDDEVHTAANAYALKHHVSYSEALHSVVAIAQADATAFSEASTEPDSDAKVHAAALRYAAEHRVSYSEAVKAVAPKPSGQAVDYSESQSPDALLDKAAQAYARVHGVGYAEALNCVRVDGSASFAEAAAGSAAQLLSMQPIEIFRAGTHTDDGGTPHIFTLADLQAIAGDYSPQRHEAPLTVGHPGDDKPAYGWVKSLQATSDGRLQMMADQIDPAFADGVKSGRYKKRSASFYPPNHPSNPTPGKWYLKHVGWLGALAPAVKGLADASFGAPSQDGAISFDF